jgi:hypothetical protein
MNDEQLETLERVRQFVEGSQAIEFKGIDAKEKYQWIEGVLRKFRYFQRQNDNEEGRD